MIKNKTQIKQEIMDKFEERIDKYINDFEHSSNADKFPIDKIEAMLGSVIHDSKKLLVDKTVGLLQNIDEVEETYKKKLNFQRMEYLLKITESASER